MMKINMSRKEFQQWKNNWEKNIPKCHDFICIHELDSCCIKYFCSQGSIYETYIHELSPVECTNVGCGDCILRYECEKKNDD